MTLWGLCLCNSWGSVKFAEKILNKEINDMTCRFEDFLKITKGDFICKVNGKRIARSDVDTEIYRNYSVVSVGIENGVLLIELKPFESVMPKCNPDEAWVKEHKAQFGGEPSFFD